MRYIKTGWYSEVREGRFLITRRVDQPFSLVLALSLSFQYSLFLYLFFISSLSLMYSLSFVGEAFVLSLSIFIQPSSLLFFLSLSLYRLRRWSDISSFFISLVRSLSLKSWTVYTLLSPRSSYSICFISFSHLAIGIRPLAQDRPTPPSLHLSPAINLLRSLHPFPFLTLCSSLCYLRTESNYTFVAVPFPVTWLSLSWPGRVNLPLSIGSSSSTYLARSSIVSL